LTIENNPLEYKAQGEKKMSCPDPLYDYEDFIDYENGYDPIMGDEWIETDDEWLDDFQGEEEFA
jgi:hypothetical protein